MSLSIVTRCFMLNTQSTQRPTNKSSAALVDRGVAHTGRDCEALNSPVLRSCNISRDAGNTKSSTNSLIKFTPRFSSEPISYFCLDGKKASNSFVKLFGDDSPIRLHLLEFLRSPSHYPAHFSTKLFLHLIAFPRM